MRNNTPKPKPKRPQFKEQWVQSKRSYESRECPEPAPITNETIIDHPLDGRRMTGWEFEKEVTEIKRVCGTWPAPVPLKTYIIAEAWAAELDQITVAPALVEKVPVFAGQAAVGDFCMAA